MLFRGWMVPSKGSQVCCRRKLVADSGGDPDLRATGIGIGSGDMDGNRTPEVSSGWPEAVCVRLVLGTNSPTDNARAMLKRPAFFPIRIVMTIPNCEWATRLRLKRDGRTHEVEYRHPPKSGFPTARPQKELSPTDPRDQQVHASGEHDLKRLRGFPGIPFAGY